MQWLFLDRVGLARMENVTIQNTYGEGVHGETHWDSYFENVQFANCGVPGSKPSLYLGCSTAAASVDSNSSSNNNKFIARRWEGDQHTACLLDKFTRLTY